MHACLHAYARTYLHAYTHLYPKQCADVLLWSELVLVLALGTTQDTGPLSSFAPGIPQGSMLVRGLGSVGIETFLGCVHVACDYVASKKRVGFAKTRHPEADG